MKMKTVSLSAVADEVLANVAQLEKVKVASATEISPSKLGTLFHKIAEELRQEPDDVTYDDLHRHLTRGGA